MPRSKKEVKGEQTENALSGQLKQAVKGLNYVSETDAPVKVFTGSKAEDVTQEILLSQIGKAKDSPVETRNFEDFFAPLIAVQDWFGDEEKANAAKFADLKNLLQSNLTKLSVFRIGSSEIDIYVVGLDTESVLTGVKTQAVET